MEAKQSNLTPLTDHALDLFVTQERKGYYYTSADLFEDVKHLMASSERSDIVYLFLLGSVYRPLQNYMSNEESCMQLVEWIEKNTFMLYARRDTAHDHITLHDEVTIPVFNKVFFLPLDNSDYYGLLHRYYDRKAKQDENALNSKLIENAETEETE